LTFERNIPNFDAIRQSLQKISVPTGINPPTIKDKPPIVHAIQRTIIDSRAQHKHEEI
jgi:hypothetical protein